MASLSFGDREYWDSRFAKDPSGFDWLLPAEALDNAIAEAVAASSSQAPRILHIGCGTSSLSSRLCSLVGSSDRVCNVDFSSVAIKASRAREAAEMPGSRMQWVVANLLSLDDILTLGKSSELGGGLYDIVVDKSTADAISCGEDVPVPLPYPLRVPTMLEAEQDTSDQSTGLVHPLSLLAVHVASLVPSGGRWLVLSYSSSRFHFLKREDHASSESLVGTGAFVDPLQLWEVAQEEPFDAPQAGEPVVGRPVVKHVLYTLIRTSIPVSLRARC
ncbi:hypothetical protein DRE_00233 [Drechslerella stenobrocha 248]|uniref:Uncharacterized protein n=1 Tax=Drechslerella stenobrocha 248 TaxID=1043628 RepID=W7I9B7_9PEZI|nr:hypothetical protein DRE_00233 [Drechslerella stenobrocha 248]